AGALRLRQPLPAGRARPRLADARGAGAGPGQLRGPPPDGWPARRLPAARAGRRPGGGRLLQRGDARPPARPRPARSRLLGAGPHPRPAVSALRALGWRRASRRPAATNLLSSSRSSAGCMFDPLPPREQPDPAPLAQLLGLEAVPPADPARPRENSQQAE